MTSLVSTLEPPILFSLAFLGVSSSTSSSAPYRDSNPHLLVLQATTGGWLEASSTATLEAPVPTVAATVDAITEIRRISGLTWEQIGELFGVDRRTVQFWASGRPLRPTHHRQLLRAYEILRRADWGSPDATRAFLLDTSQGRSLIDLLVDQDWVQAESRVLGRVALPRPAEPRPLSAAEREARRLLSLEATLDRSEEPVKLASIETLRAPSRQLRGRTK